MPDDEYDWRDDAKKCYELAIKVKRERGDKHWPKQNEYCRIRSS